MKAFIDIETSGLDPFKHEVIEVAYILDPGPRRGESREEAFSLSFDESSADPKALEINGWGKRTFAPRISRSQAAAKLKKDLFAAVPVGNGVHFDMEFLGHFLRDWCVIKRPWSHRYVDLKSLAAGKLGIDPELLPTDVIAGELDVPLHKEEAHTALGDARWNRRLYYALGLVHL